MANGTPRQHVQLKMSGFLSPPRKQEVIDLISDEDDLGTSTSASNAARNALNGISQSANNVPGDSKDIDILHKPMQPLESSQAACDGPVKVEHGAANEPASLDGDANRTISKSKLVDRTVEHAEDSDGSEDSEDGRRAYINLMQSTQHAAARKDAVNTIFEPPRIPENLLLDQEQSKKTSDNESTSESDNESESDSGDDMRLDHLTSRSEAGANGNNGVGEIEVEDEEDELLEGHIDDDMMSDIVHGLMDDVSDEEELTDEAHDLIRELRRDGIHEFVHRHLESGDYTADRICTLFGCPLPDILRDMDNFDDLSLSILGKLLMREISRRRKLPQYNTIDDAANLLKTSRRILVLTGAGISTSLGIPDFRSSNGLYAQLAASGLADKVDDPQDVFSMRVFRDDPTIFYTVARSILSSDRRFSPTHQFIRLIQDKGKLQTNFTQNIDNLEAAAGIDTDKLIHCHGSFATATCQTCGYNIPGDNIHDQIRAGSVPRCRVCLARLRKLRASNQLGMKRKRSSTSIKARKSKSSLNDWDEDDTDDEMEDFSDNAAGVMKPDIIFFGEDLSDAFHQRAIADKPLVDLVVVIGTSLKVAPVSEVPNFIPSEVPQIYISRDPCRHIVFDIQLLGECDVVVAELCKRAGWSLQHEMVPEGGYQVDVKESSKQPGRNWVKRKDEDEAA